MTYTNATDLGPLQILIGTWQGLVGTDLSPEPDGTETNRYRERLTFNPVRPFSNAEEQQLLSVQYHQVIHRIIDNKQIHDQCGYWSWDAKSETVFHSFSIPRGLSLIAGGTVSVDEKKRHVFQVNAAVDDPEWPISQAPFLKQKALTKSFVQELSVAGSELHYKQTTSLDIYGRSFDHIDEATLIRVS